MHDTSTVGSILYYTRVHPYIDTILHMYSLTCTYLHIYLSSNTYLRLTGSKLVRCLLLGVLIIPSQKLNYIDVVNYDA